MAEKKQSKREEELLAQIAELTNDLQRMRADFENYRKRAETEKLASRESGQTSAILKLIPSIDTIERAITHLPDELKDNAWAQGVVGLVAQLERSLEGLQVKRIDSSQGTPFDPTVHEAIQFDEEAEGDNEVIAEELQAGYTLNGSVIRPAMVKVTRQ